MASSSNNNAASGCPFHGANTTVNASATETWWPEQLNLKILSYRENPATSPMCPEFDYAAAFSALDLAAVKADLAAVMTDSKVSRRALSLHLGRRS